MVRYPRHTLHEQSSKRHVTYCTFVLVLTDKCCVLDCVVDKASLVTSGFSLKSRSMYVAGSYPGFSCFLHHILAQNAYIRAFKNM